MKLNILISHSTSTKTLRLQIHLKLFKEAFWSWQETSWGLLTGYLVDNLQSAFLTFTNIKKNINHQECFLSIWTTTLKLFWDLLYYRLSLHVDGNSQFNQPNWTKETSIYWKIRWELEKLFLIFFVLYIRVLIQKFSVLHGSAMQEWVLWKNFFFWILCTIRVVRLKIHSLNGKYKSASLMNYSEF